MSMVIVMTLFASGSTMLAVAILMVVLILSVVPPVIIILQLQVPDLGGFKRGPPHVASVS